MKPYCTVGLSSLQICSLVAEFITLFSGILLVINEFIGADKKRTGQSNSDMDYQTQIVAFMIFISNFLVMLWPFIQILGFIDVRDNCSDVRTHLCGVKQNTENKTNGGGFSISSIVFFSKHQRDGRLKRPDQVIALDAGQNNSIQENQSGLVTAVNVQLSQIEAQPVVVSPEFQLGSAGGELLERIEPLISTIQPVAPELTYELYPGVALDDTNQEVVAQPLFHISI
jgi:hypothetical protein